MSGPAPAVTLSDRLMQAFRALVREEFPRLTFFGIYEYIVAVSSIATNTAALSPSDTTLGLPGIVNVPLRLSFTAAQLTIGSKVLVAFVNGDPARAVVIAADTGAQISIASGVLPAARMGDAVTAGPFVGSVTSGSFIVKIG